MKTPRHLQAGVLVALAVGVAALLLVTLQNNAVVTTGTPPADKPEIANSWPAMRFPSSDHGPASRPGSLDTQHADVEDPAVPATQETEALLPFDTDGPQGPFPESIPIAGDHRTFADVQRAIDAGLPVTYYGPGPGYDDDGDLVGIKTRRPDGGLRTQLTWGEPRADDLEAEPRPDSLLVQFGTWMQREDGLYEVGFLAGDGRFFRYDCGAFGEWGHRAGEEVPTGRGIPMAGSQSVYRIPCWRDVTQFGRVRGGYAIPGYRVDDHAETGDEENIFVTFEGHQRIAFDRLRWIWEHGRGGDLFFKMWQVNPEVVVIPRPPE